MELFEQFEDRVPEKAPDGSDWIDLDTFPVCDVCIDFLAEEAEQLMPISKKREHPCDSKKHSFWIECKCVCNNDGSNPDDYVVFG